MTRFVQLVLAATLLLAFAPATAHAAPTNQSHTFEAVDGVSARFERFRIEGLVLGETTPREVEFGFFGGSSNDQMRAECLRLALLSQAKPGHYNLAIEVQSGGVSGCKLKRR